MIRPTGLLEPSVEIRPARNQVQDLIKEIKKRTTNSNSGPAAVETGAGKQRILVTTLTKRSAEELSDYLSETGIKTQWLHSEIKVLERPKILGDLRLGKYDVLIGINLLREGLDLPEVALIAILDADKEGFLRNETSLIQTMGRAARHPKGHIILYADKITKSIKEAIKEVSRRRKIQERYNKIHHIQPKPIIKSVREWPFASLENKSLTEFMASGEKLAPELWMIRDQKILEKEMKIAAKNLDFERAAEIRDLITKFKKQNPKHKVA